MKLQTLFLLVLVLSLSFVTACATNENGAGEATQVLADDSEAVEDEGVSETADIASEDISEDLAEDFADESEAIDIGSII